MYVGQTKYVIKSLISVFLRKRLRKAFVFEKVLKLNLTNGEEDSGIEKYINRRWEGNLIIIIVLHIRVDGN